MLESKFKISPVSSASWFSSSREYVNQVPE